MLREIVRNKLDILLISETKVDPLFPTSQFAIEGFSSPFRLFVIIIIIIIIIIIAIIIFIITFIIIIITIIIIIIIITIHLFQFGCTKIVHKIINYNLNE